MMARFVLILGFLGLSLPLAGQGAAYCAFEVRVRTPAGSPVANLPVALIRSEQTTLSETRTNGDGLARICDAPLEYLGIAVGSDICGSVLVRHLAPSWPEPRRVFVTYVDAPCNHFTVSPSCRILLRVHDEGGKPVVGARFEGRSTTARTDVTDVFGRLFYSLKRGEALDGTVTKRELRSPPIAQTCEDMENVELKIVLRDTRRP
jgi:hypothetical protein